MMLPNEIRLEMSKAGWHHSRRAVRGQSPKAPCTTFTFPACLPGSPAKSWPFSLTSVKLVIGGSMSIDLFPEFFRLMRWTRIAIIISLLIPMGSIAQQRCDRGVRIEGSVADPSGAVIPGAQVRLQDGEITTSDPAGNFAFACVQWPRPSCMCKRMASPLPRRRRGHSPAAPQASR